MGGLGLVFLFFFFFLQIHLKARNHTFCIMNRTASLPPLVFFPTSALKVMEGGALSLSDSLIITLDYVCFQKRQILGIGTLILDLLGLVTRIHTVFENFVKFHLQSFSVLLTQ